jgi:hypothetical protein
MSTENKTIFYFKLYRIYKFTTMRHTHKIPVEKYPQNIPSDNSKGISPHTGSANKSLHHHPHIDKDRTPNHQNECRPNNIPDKIKIIFKLNRTQWAHSQPMAPMHIHEDMSAQYYTGHKQDLEHTNYHQGNIFHYKLSTEIYQHFSTFMNIPNPDLHPIWYIHALYRVPPPEHIHHHIQLNL